MVKNGWKNKDGLVFGVLLMLVGDFVELFCGVFTIALTRSGF